MFDGLRSKYYATVDAARLAAEAPDPLRVEREPNPRADFNFLDFGAPGPVSRLVNWLVTHRNLHAFLRVLFPIIRFQNVIYVWRHRDVAAVLKNSKQFRTPYGEEMEDLSGGTNFFLGMSEGEGYRRQRRFMLQAMEGAIGQIDKPWVQSDDSRAVGRISETGDIEEIVKPWANAIGNQLVRDSGGQIDAVADLIVPGVSEVCGIYYGLDLKDRDAFAEWAMAVSTLLFHDPFGDATARRLALAGVERIRAVVDRSIDRAGAIIARRNKLKKTEASTEQSDVPSSLDIQRDERWLRDTLVGRLVELQQSSKPGVGPTDDEIRTITIGIISGLVPPMILTASRVLEFLLCRRDAWLMTREAARNGDDGELEKCLAEAMRFSPPINPGLFRVATCDTTIGMGLRKRFVHEGETVFVATASAVMDGRVETFRRPRRFDPNREQSNDLIFGGYLHWCIGERVAKAVLTQLLRPLLRQDGLQRQPPGLRPSQFRVGTLRRVGSFPRHLEMKFEPADGHRQQNHVTIVAEITKRVEPEDLKAAIVSLGNPANGEIGRALDGTNRVHFASLSAVNIKRNGSEAELDRSASGIAYFEQDVSHLYFELNVDGPAESAIDAIVERAGHLLLPVFGMACDVGTVQQLSVLLKANVVKFARFSPFSRRTLEFSGTPGHPVSEIEQEYCIEQRARASLDKVLRQNGKLGTFATSALRAVRRDLRNPNGTMSAEDARVFSAQFVRSGQFTIPASSRKDLSRDRPFYDTLWNIAKPAIVHWRAYLTFALFALTFGMMHVYMFKRSQFEALITDDQGVIQLMGALVSGGVAALVAVPIAIALFTWWYCRRDMQQAAFWKAIIRNWRVTLFRIVALYFGVALLFGLLIFLTERLTYLFPEPAWDGLAMSLAYGFALTLAGAAVAIAWGTGTWAHLKPGYWKPFLSSLFAMFLIAGSVVLSSAIAGAIIWFAGGTEVDGGNGLPQLLGDAVDYAALGATGALIFARGWQVWRAQFVFIAFAISLGSFFVGNYYALQFGDDGSTLSLVLWAAIYGPAVSLLLTAMNSEGRWFRRFALIALVSTAGIFLIEPYVGWRPGVDQGELPTVVWSALSGVSLALLLAETWYLVSRLTDAAWYWRRGNVAPVWNHGTVCRFIIIVASAAAGTMLVSGLLPTHWDFEGFVKVGANFLGSFMYGVLWASLSIVGLVTLIVLTFRAIEKADSVDDRAAPQEWLDQFDELENAEGYAQNHVLAVAPLKPEPGVRFPLLVIALRRISLTLALWGVRSLSEVLLRPGFVLDMGTIHFARLFRMSNSDMLIFCSNYDGSWESYLEDFITKAHAGQTALWSNCIGFPTTRFLLFGGAEDGDRFKRWVRRQQVPTLFWYSRFPQLTTDHIRTNALIRDGLARAKTDSDAQAWMDLFSSTPRPPEALETAEIQTILFGGLSKLTAAEMIGLKFPEAASTGERESKEMVRDWLRDITAFAMDGATGGEISRVSFDEKPSEDQAMVVGLSASGLSALGLDRMGTKENGGNALGSFPDSFRDGMYNRSKILGDDHQPDWDWGGDQPVDAVLLIYAKSGKALKRAIRKERKVWKRFGLEQIAHIEMTLLEEKDVRPADTKPSGSGQGASDSSQPSARYEDGNGKKAYFEHFGFRDGISQPVIEGTRRFHEGVNANHTVKPGEFVLGYHNNLGYYPPTPVVSPEHDRNSILANRPRGLPDRYPDFGSSELEAPRDLGRNGSFLVIRQLQQHVERFESYVADQASETAGKCDGKEQKCQAANLKRGEKIAAKMMGRWKDGSSLVRYPDSPPDGDTVREPDNDFLFGVDDPQGLRCPFGAHVRRVNPRDSFRAGSEQQIAISNRHRLLRVGRTYKKKDQRGLLFMCLNADIERQFEFIQQTWIGSPSFHGLRNERDPIAANADHGHELNSGATQPDNGKNGQENSGNGEFTVPTLAGPKVLKGLPSFVTIRGGGYFFVPSRSALQYLCSIEPESQEREARAARRRRSG